MPGPAAIASGLTAGQTLMQAHGQPPEAIRAFAYYYELLARGEKGWIDSKQVQAVEILTDYEELDGFELIGHGAIGKVVVLKLNGGLGTTMGLTGPRCLVPVQEGLTFLDITVDQVLYLRRQLNRQLPLLFMNSFHTQAATAQALHRCLPRSNGLPLTFEQHRMPKIDAETLQPVTGRPQLAQAWCPPGHGDLYATLRTTGLLDLLTAQGYEYVFVSNADNLGAVLDLRILGYMVECQVPMLMEAAYRTLSDRKGGHLSKGTNGQLVIREFAQCPPTERDQFQDIRTFPYFNTNNIWLHLPSLRDYLAEQDGFMRLVPIFNRKPLDPRKPAGRQIIQLESALGSAISVFPGATAIRVPRSRFLPVKRCEDLLVMQSDVYQVNLQSRFIMNPKRLTATPPRRPPQVDLDPRFYGTYDRLRARFPQGAPSMVNCASLRIEGDVIFGRDIRLEGHVVITNERPEARILADGQVIRGDLPG